MRTAGHAAASAGPRRRARPGRAPRAPLGRRTGRSRTKVASERERRRPPAAAGRHRATWLAVSNTSGSSSLTHLPDAPISQPTPRSLERTRTPPCRWTRRTSQTHLPDGPAGWSRSGRSSGRGASPVPAPTPPVSPCRRSPTAARRRCAVGCTWTAPARRPLSPPIPAVCASTPRASSPSPGSCTTRTTPGSPGSWPTGFTRAVPPHRREQLQWSAATAAWACYMRAAGPAATGCRRARRWWEPAGPPRRRAECRRPEGAPRCAPGAGPAGVREGSGATSRRGDR